MLLSVLVSSASAVRCAIDVREDAGHSSESRPALAAQSKRRARLLPNLPRKEGRKEGIHLGAVQTYAAATKRVLPNPTGGASLVHLTLVRAVV